MRVHEGNTFFPSFLISVSKVKSTSGQRTLEPKETIFSSFLMKKLFYYKGEDSD